MFGWRKTAAFALLVGTACAPGDTNEAVDRNGPAASVEKQESNIAVETSNADASGKPSASLTASSILAWSRPAAGSTVSAPASELVFHFSPAASLTELTVSGTDGTMPMMVNAVGEVEHYSLPFAADTPGSYIVTWRATAGGRKYQGTFNFTIR